MISVESEPSARSSQALDRTQPSVGQGSAQVLGFLGKARDEGVQSERIGRQCQHHLHGRGRLIGEIVEGLDRES
jgi:hypothetical protein